MNGTVLVFHLLVLLFGRRWLSAVPYLSGQFITSQQGHFGLYPAVSSAQAAQCACGWPLTSGLGWMLLITGALFAEVRYTGQENTIHSAKAVNMSAGVH